MSVAPRLEALIDEHLGDILPIDLPEPEALETVPEYLRKLRKALIIHLESLDHARH